MMGLEITAKDGPIPRDLVLKLTCDGDHGLLPAPSQTFEGKPFPDLRHDATVAGWKETYAPGRVGGLEIERRFLCPECSGK